MGDEPYQEATFTYQIIAQSTDALGISDLPMPAGSAQDAQESEVNVYGGTTTQIPSIVFTKPGNYIYKVKQVRVSDEGYEGDGAEYTLIFHVTQVQRELGIEKEQTSDQTTLEATTEIQKFGNRVEGLVFNNRYTLPRFQVSFDVDGAKDVIGTQSVRYEMLAEQPDTPEKDGYVFGGWIDEASGPYNFLTPVTKDVHLKATWAKEMYFVEFREDVSADEPYKDEVLSAGRYSYGESVVAPPAPNHKLGYKFKGWNKDFSNVSSDMLIRATYEPIHYTIHYNANGGSGQMSDQDRTYERQEKLKSNEFSHGDDIFVGWAKSPDAQVPDYTENANAVNLTTNDGEVIQLYAVWKKVEPAKATLEVRKEIDGEVPAQKDIFHFTLMAMQTDAKNVTVMPTPEGTQRSYNFTITGDNKKTLNQIVFTEPGNYIYQLTEQDDGLPGYVADKSTYEIVILKGIFSGTGSFIIAILLEESIPDIKYILISMLLGFVAYGLSIFLYIRAQRDLGAAKTSAYYAIAPFIGTFLSFVVDGDRLTKVYFIGLIFMIIGSVIVVYDTMLKNHIHYHVHTIVHTHNGSTHKHVIKHEHTHSHLGSDEKHTHHHDDYINSDEHKRIHEEK